MTISSVNDLQAAAKQTVQLSKPGGALAAVAAGAVMSLFPYTGTPGAGVLAGGATVGSTTAGLVPDDTVPGYPTINAFGGSATGYLTKVDFSSNLACRVTLYDRLFVAGAYSFNAAAGAMAAQPSYAARLPLTDYGCCELWYEQVTVATGIQNVAVTYTRGDGTTGRTTGTIAAPITNMPVQRCFQLPLQAGDSGIRTIESVTGTIATVGTFNIMILRELWSGRVPFANSGDIHKSDRTDMVRVYDNSALYVLVSADSTVLGLPDLRLQISNL